MNVLANAPARPEREPATGVASVPTPHIGVWSIDLLMDIEDGEPCPLDANEHARCAGFAFERERRRFTRTRTALRRTLSRELGIAPQRLELTSGPFGKPLLLGPRQVAFNVSHSAELALIAVGSNVDSVGIDVESYRSLSDATEMAASYFSAAERSALAVARDPALRFLEIWTRKEAAIKALGLGLGALNLTTLHVGYQGVLRVRVAGTDVELTTLHDVADGFVASIAYVTQTRASADINMMTMTNARAAAPVEWPGPR